MDEETRLAALVGFGQAAENICPAVDTVGVGRSQGDTGVAVLIGNGHAIELPGEYIRASGKPAQILEFQGPRRVAPKRGSAHAVAANHSSNRLGMAIGQPEALDVLV